MVVFQFFYTFVLYKLTALTYETKCAFFILLIDGSGAIDCLC